MLKSYRFTKYRTKEDADAKPRIRSLVFQSEDPAAAKKSLRRGVGGSRRRILHP